MSSRGFAGPGVPAADVRAGEDHCRSLLREPELGEGERLFLRRHHRRHHHRPLEGARAASGVADGRAPVPKQGSQHPPGRRRAARELHPRGERARKRATGSGSRPSWSSARDGYQVWADRFDGLVEDIFDLQNEASRKIVEALKVSLTEVGEGVLGKKADRRPARVRLLHARTRVSEPSREKNTEAAIRMFENALAIDADFAAAFAGLGEACASMYEWYDGRSHWLARAIEMNQEALSRDPGSVEVQFGIAMVYYHQGRLAEAKRTLLSVLEADPQYVRGLHASRDSRGAQRRR